MDQPGQCWKPAVSKIATYVQSGKDIRSCTADEERD
jgi:hypothetical protein